jgi:hypothetical protein
MSVYPTSSDERERAAIDISVAYLESIGYIDFSISNHRLGGYQSVIFKIIAYKSASPLSTFVLKVFKRDYIWNSAESLQNEYNLLGLFSNALVNEELLTCPLPVALFRHEKAYLMTEIPGEQFDKYLPANPEDLIKACSQIARGLSVYYKSTGEAYGEFSSTNILVDPLSGQVGFVDPSYPRVAKDYRLLFSPASDDAGFWLAGLCARSPRMIISNPIGYRRRWNHALTLLSIISRYFAPKAQNDFLAETASVALQYIKRMNKDSTLKSKVIFRLAVVMNYQVLSGRIVAPRVYTDNFKHIFS